MKMLRNTVYLQSAAALAFFAALALAGASAQSGSGNGSKSGSGNGLRPASVVPAAAPAKEPSWPVNEAPKPAVVQWDSRGLSIQAENSSLKEILDEVAEKTGAKLEGFIPGGSTDQRVFGEYGPGTANTVLAQLLNGSGYNVMLIGDQGQGTPREIVLSKPSPPGSEPPRPAQDSEDEDYEPPPVVRPPMVQQPLMRWRRMQEMQQRQQQQNNTQRQY